MGHVCRWWVAFILLVSSLLISGTCTCDLWFEAQAPVHVVMSWITGKQWRGNIVTLSQPVDCPQVQFVYTERDKYNMPFLITECPKDRCRWQEKMMSQTWTEWYVASEAHQGSIKAPLRLCWVHVRYTLGTPGTNACSRCTYRVPRVYLTGTRHMWWWVNSISSCVCVCVNIYIYIYI